MYYPGQKYRPSAARENEIDRLLRDARAGSVSYESADPGRMPLGHMMAKNTTGTNLGFACCALYRLGAFTNTEEPWTRADYDPRKGFIDLVALTNVVSNPPAGQEIGGLAITLEPIVNNTLGRVAIAGIAFLAEPIVGTQMDQRYLYPHSTGLRTGYFGFARRLAVASPNTDYQLVDLSDRKLECAYTLTSNMGSGSANAVLDPGVSWTTTVHDVHAIAAYQKTGDKGFAEWRGTRWCIKIPFC